ncbi:FAD-binding oxidoreductase [Haloechinothrix salitolerans]|uniref:Delta(24)-sterol reductase n=1 Tax=Haloechinothrix salitolerans TaxID=926830 RepID=A0ABW2BVS4_9PSEU
MGGSRASSTYGDAVRDLRQQLASAPPGTPPRLAKRTSNLFRFREPPTGPVLDVSAFSGVFDVDPDARTADVGGMTTYEDLVDATLPHGLMPLVVPQLKTITLGGAVAGLGIESTSFRNGLPHESVLEMDNLTGNGDVVLARPDNEHSDLFFGFPNSYGTLGYAVRLRIELEPVRPTVALRHLRFANATECAEAIAEICKRHAHGDDAAPVDFIDGTVFGPDEYYLTLGRFTDDIGPRSDYTGNRIYYHSIRERTSDALSVRDYLWRWDTDWFWCSRALGAQHPLVRPLWPKRYLRSDVYRRIVAWDRRHRFSDRVRALTRAPRQEPVIQDIEVPVDRLAEFMDFFHRDVGITPIWLCPLRLRGTRTWPLYPLEPETLYVNVGFWSAVDLRDDEEVGDRNAEIERVVTALDGHKSLYSTSFYTEDEFRKLYNGAEHDQLKRRYDPDGRLPGWYDKCVRGR